jgi:regulator of replication initiation timing
MVNVTLEQRVENLQLRNEAYQESLVQLSREVHDKMQRIGNLERELGDAKELILDFGKRVSELELENERLRGRLKAALDV